MIILLNHQVHQDHLLHQAHQAHQDHLIHQVHQVLQDHLIHQAHQVHQDHLTHQAHLVHLGQNLHRTLHDLQVQKLHRHHILAHLIHLVVMEEAQIQEVGLVQADQEGQIMVQAVDTLVPEVAAAAVVARRNSFN